MRDITFTAKDAQMMMGLQESVLMGVFGRIYGQIQAMAFEGNSGTRIKVPLAIIKYVEFNVRIQEMIDNGFTVCDGQVINGEYVFDVYWAE